MALCCTPVFFLPFHYFTFNYFSVICAEFVRMEIFYENLGRYTHGMTTMFFIVIPILLYQKREKNSLIRFLYRVMLFWLAIFLKDIIYLIDGLWANTRVTHITVSIDMLCIPVFSMFLFEVVKPGWANFKRAFLMLLPTIILATIVIITDNQQVFDGLIIYSNVLAAVIAVLTLRSTRKFKEYIEKNYSYTETISISWLRTVVFLLLVLLLIWSVVTWKNSMLGKSAYYLSSIVVFTHIYLQTMRHHIISVPDMLNPFMHDTDEDNDIEPENEPSVAETAYFAAKLQQIMEERQLYLNPLLTLRDVAYEIGTNRTYLSEYLNREMKTKFYDYVNSYRIREAEKLLLKNKETKLEEIAEQCGFNSLSTFLRSFEKTNKTTPTKFRASRAE